jgi:hypothetical protein
VFYEISLTTVASTLAVNILAVALPVYLLRPRSLTHSADAPISAVPDRNIIHDSSIIAINSLLGAAIYAATIFGAVNTALPVWLVTHFTGLPSLTAAHQASTLPALFIMLGLFLPVGYAAREFLFTPSLGYQTQPHLGNALASAFNPETADLKRTFQHNLGLDNKRKIVLAQRTSILGALTFVSTMAQVFARVDGAELLGAAGYAGPWVLSVILTAGAFYWEENV